MKKLLSIALVLTMVLCLLSGCGVFGSSNGGGETEGGSSNTDGVQITEKFTLHAPEGLDYDRVYAIKSEPTGDNLVSEYNAENGMLAMWMVIYAKGDKLVGEHDLYVLPDQAGVDMMLEEAEDPSQYTIPEEDPFVMVSFWDAEYQEGIVIAYQSFGMLPDPCTAYDYAECYAELIGGIIVG